MRFVTFVKRCDGPTLIRCLMEAFEYFGGLPKAQYISLKGFRPFYGRGKISNLSVRMYFV